MLKPKDIFLLLVVIALTFALVPIGNWANGVVIFDNLPQVINKQIAYQSVTLLATILFLLFLWGVKRKQFREYFKKGNVSAEILPEPIVGINPKPTENWYHFGRNFA
ncbi:MAG TPA: hypothetical protein DCF46_07720, partial [Porphyromonadaceae bacterium]|nr:hypothetical protein [Porphyromonadaceae bacterium]HBK42316.1 hypothetical protein [Porphyromonadaceae bacterium]